MAIRALFYPTLAFNRLICALGIWNRWDAIDEHVILGGLPSRRDLERLAELGVGGIVNMCGEFPGYKREIEELGMTQLHLPTLDFHPPSRHDIERGLDFTQQRIHAGEKVYVHCKAGRGRGATLALCYLVAHHTLSAQQAYERLKAARPQIDRGLDLRPVVSEFEQMVPRSLGQ